MRKIILLVIALVLLSLIAFGFIKYRTKIHKESLYPNISTVSLSDGKVGEYYKAEIVGSLIGEKAKLNMKMTDITNGLTLGICIQEYNSSLFPRPNSVIKCDLEGYPQAVGVNQISFEIEAEDYANSIIKNLSLIIASN